MKRYIALLRGINVGSKNKIIMSELKNEFIELDFSEVKTYLNSGNIIFSVSTENKNIIFNKIKLMIKDKFGLDIPIYIVLQEELKELLENAPEWWGNDDKEIYDNLIFIISPLSYRKFRNEVGNLKEEYETAQNFRDVVFWSFNLKNYQKTNWWSKTANTKVKDMITIRTANTVRKIVDM